MEATALYFKIISTCQKSFIKVLFFLVKNILYERILAQIAKTWPVAFLILFAQEVFLNPDFSISAKKSFSGRALPIHLNKSFILFIVSSGSLSFKTISQNTVLPPGFKTL